MRLLKRGLRSSLYRDGETVFRLYHDTSEWVEVPVNVDERGTRRYEQNCTERGLCRSDLPPYLARARSTILSSKNIGEVAAACGVKESTAWNYVTKLCEDADVATHILSSGGYICPELETAASEVDLDGSLKNVMARIEEVLQGNIVWRCEHDRFSQLRLLRVCVTSLKRSRT